MAPGLLRELERLRAKIERNAHNPAALTRAFISVSELVPSYFTTSVGETQSREVLESRTRHSWRWVELPQFPLRRFLPLAARALCRFPEERGLVLMIADLCTDLFKQNMIAKMEGMRCGILQGLCSAAGQVALSEPFSQDDMLFAERIFGAIRKVVEPASIGFYSQPVDVKEEFYSVERSAWGEVNVGDTLRVLAAREGWESFDGPPAANHAILLTLHYIKKHPAMTNMDHYLEVLRNIAEAFGNMFPTVAENAAFSSFVKDTLETARRPAQPQHLTRIQMDLIDEALLIYKRTLNPSEFPWNHSKPALLPALNRLYVQGAGLLNLVPLSLLVGAENLGRQEHRATVCETARKYESTCAKCSRLQSERPRGDPPFRRCARCQSVFYCGANCQRLHWREHRQVCVAP
ncbi:hypothetical protein KFL_007360030 [Klebsormidium nitens]|uniref:MYND-type domain-containing protein n=1 Tax=Klebsormidium nitens TaxID=105231 RepID=A0A1Y1ISK5_KLENI|nr:hypothetical protein KFL_007360030 [Klebsormidium nitens]|eukprot:GAQ91158.1 hypothetical protein KFL_007360030 [Klebsormidium nitens]